MAKPVARQLVPGDFRLWRRTPIGRDRIVARRNGVALIFQSLDEGRWTVTKVMGGHVLAVGTGSLNKTTVGLLNTVRYGTPIFASAKKSDRRANGKAAQNGGA